MTPVTQRRIRQPVGPAGRLSPSIVRREHARRIRVGFSDAAAGRNWSAVQAARGAERRRARRRRSAAGLLADGLCLRFDAVQVELFVKATGQRAAGDGGLPRQLRG